MASVELWWLGQSGFRLQEPDGVPPDQQVWESWQQPENLGAGPAGNPGPQGRTPKEPTDTDCGPGSPRH